MIRKLFCLLAVLLSLVFGYWMGEARSGNKKIVLKQQPMLKPNRDVPFSEYKSFAIVVYSYKDAAWCIRSLCSIFEQDYDHFRVLFIDDGSRDGTFDKVQSFAIENHQDHRIILIQNQQHLGRVACMHRAIDQLLDREIAIPIDAKDWLAHPRVLSRLNAVYQNPDVWLTASSPMLYPSYEMSPALERLDAHPSAHIPVSFYAALFKQIRLSDLVQEGRFVEKREAYLSPIIQMSGERFRLLNEPLFIANLTRSCRETESKPISSYPPLSDFPSGRRTNEKADIVLFSCDRPMQLYACLESIDRYVSGYERISVICRSSDRRYREGYQKVQETFPEVRFIFQSSDPKRDFKPLVLKTVFDSPSAFVLFGVDDQVATDFIDLKKCMEMMEKTGAYGFYLRLGQQITDFYQCGRKQSVPQSVLLAQRIYAWNIHIGHSDWEFFNTLDMTLYRKKDLKAPFEKMRYKTPNSLEFTWAKEVHPEREIGLYFEHSKVVNIPLNIVSRTGNSHMNYLSVEELLSKFEQGLKIDIDPLYRIDNASPYIEHEPEFILRSSGEPRP